MELVSTLIFSTALCGAVADVPRPPDLFPIVRLGNEEETFKRWVLYVDGKGQWILTYKSREEDVCIVETGNSADIAPEHIVPTWPQE